MVVGGEIVFPSFFQPLPLCHICCCFGTGSGVAELPPAPALISSLSHWRRSYFRHGEQVAAGVDRGVDDEDGRQSGQQREEGEQVAKETSEGGRECVWKSVQGRE